MKLVEAFLTKNPCYRAGKKIAVKGLMLHSVGCPQPRASVFIVRLKPVLEAEFLKRETERKETKKPPAMQVRVKGFSLQ